MADGLEQFTNGLPNLQRAYDKLLLLDATSINNLYAVSVNDIEPIIREELRASYTKSGIQQRGKFKSRGGDAPGKLFEMIVQDVKDQLVKSKTGLTLRYPAGYPKSVYIRASVFTTGGVYGTKLRVNKQNLKFKKTIKKLAKKGVAPPHKVWIIPGRNLYVLDTGQKQHISDEFDKAFTARLLVLVN